MQSARVIQTHSHRLTRSFRRSDRNGSTGCEQKKSSSPPSISPSFLLLHSPAFRSSIAQGPTLLAQKNRFAGFGGTLFPLMAGWEPPPGSAIMKKSWRRVTRIAERSIKDLQLRTRLAGYSWLLEPKVISSEVTFH